MAIAEIWTQVSQNFTANGTSNGLIQVANTAGFYVNAKVRIVSNTQPSKLLEIKRVDGTTQIWVGAVGAGILDRADLSAYLVADNATITLYEQQATRLAYADIQALTYAHEPILAKRVIMVDKYGRYYDEDNPLPISASISGDVYVDLDALTPPNQPNPDNVLIVGSEDGTKGGLKHAARVDSELDLRVGISDGTNKANVNSGGELSTTDAQTHSLLNNTNTILSDIEAGIPESLGQQAMANSMPVVIASDQSSVPVSVDDPLKISGTENGLPGGPEFTFVNNRRLQILSAKDRVQSITYADFGTKDQRITQIDYTAPSIGVGPGFTARKTFIYVLDSGKYKRTSIIWSII